MKLSGVIVESFDHEGHAVHHFPQSPSLGKFLWAVEFEEMAEVALLHFRATELVYDKVHQESNGVIGFHVSALRAARAPSGTHQ